MKRVFSAIAIALVFAVAAGAALSVSAQGPPPEVLLKTAMKTELVDGDLAGAIRQYKEILTRFPRNREIVAKTLLQLGACHEKLGSREARQSYERIVREYSDIDAVAPVAKARLAALGGGAGLPFPQRTLDPIFEYGSPDGRHVVYHKGEDPGRVYVRDLTTNAERVLVDLEGYATNFAWSPDSRFLAFDYQHPPKKLRETRIVSIAAGQLRTMPVRHGYPFDWTTGGLFLYRPNYGANAVEFALADPEDGTLRRTLSQPTPDGCCPRLSPDGRFVIAPRGKRLMMVELATGTERPVTTGSAEETRHLLSPDGRLVAFASNRDGRWGIYVAPLDRIPVREPVLISYVDNPELLGPRRGRQDWWTTSGLLSLAIAYSDSNVFRVAMDPKTGRAVDTPQRLTQDSARNFLPTVSPDGGHIAFHYRSAARGGIAVMDSAGVTERRLVDQQGTLQVFWRNAQEILFYDFGTGGGQRPAITSLNIKTGLTSALTQVDGLYWRYVPARDEILHTHPGGGGARKGVPVRARSLARGTDRLVATIDYLIPRFAVSADGNTLAYSVTSDLDTTGARCELRLMSMDGQPGRTLIPRQQPCIVPVAWSPDGRFLLLNSAAGPPRVLNVATAESWPLHPTMADQPRWDTGSWSPDGSFIALTRSADRLDRLAWDGVTYEAVARLLTRSARR